MKLNIVYMYNIYNFTYFTPTELQIQPIDYIDSNQIVTASYFNEVPTRNKVLIIHPTEFNTDQIYNKTYKADITKQTDKQSQSEQNRLEQCKQYIEILKSIINKARIQHHNQLKKIAALKKQIRQNIQQ